ncbi:Permeases of the major facilitator superfamily [Pseudomonas batumici]|uniref:Permeases of the major facilitator superfamily n=1 Tax=Pseudomonas batumici TaxID=226910 RepID=A0A0C2I103_9PSED|nr:Permeases of the major facilitator superfamily [Pseudomonas batumici]
MAWAAAMGNGLETYDFTVYSFSAVAIGKLFFPSDSAFASLLLSLLTFGAGFAMRPIGAWFIGQLARTCPAARAAVRGAGND